MSSTKRVILSLIVSVALFSTALGLGTRTFSAWFDSGASPFGFDRANTAGGTVKLAANGALYGPTGLVCSLTTTGNCNVGGFKRFTPASNYQFDAWYNFKTVNTPDATTKRNLHRAYKRGVANPRLGILFLDLGTTFELTGNCRDSANALTAVALDTIPQDTWFHVHAHYYAAHTGGFCKIWVDGVLRQNTTGLNTNGCLIDSTQTGLMTPLAATPTNTGIVCVENVWMDSNSATWPGVWNLSSRASAQRDFRHEYDFDFNVYSIPDSDAARVIRRQSGAFIVDDFDDGVLDTTANSYSSVLDTADHATKWNWLGGGGAVYDSLILMEETGGYLRLYADGLTRARGGQHNGIQSRSYAAHLNNGWTRAILDTIDLVAICDLKNVYYDDLVTPSGAESRLEFHLCSNCPGVAVDHNSSVTIGYLVASEPGVIGDDWPEGGMRGWGGRYLWKDYATRALYILRLPAAGPDSLFGDEATEYHAGMIATLNPPGSTQPTDSTDIATYVFGDGAWAAIDTQAVPQMYMGSRCKVELKSMAQYAYGTGGNPLQIEYRFDNFRLFPSGTKYPARFDLKKRSGLALPIEGASLQVYCVRTDALVDADTLGASDSEFAIYLDQTEIVIPESLSCVVRGAAGDTLATFALPGSNVTGAYPDDVYDVILNGY